MGYAVNVDGNTYSVGIENATYQVAVNTGIAINNGSWVSVFAYGAAGDGTTDDTASLQAAHDAAEALGGGTVQGGTGKTFKITDTLDWNAKRVGFQGLGCVIDATELAGAAGTPAIMVTGADSQYGHYQGLNGFKLVGPGDNSDKVGVAFNDTTASYSAKGGQYSFSITAFGVGLDFRNRAYLVSMFGSEVYDCGIGVRVPTGYSDYGENITMFGCAVFNNGVGIQINNQNCDFRLFGTSVDYNTVQVDLDAGVLDCAGCHLEWSTAHTVPPFTLAEGTRLIISNSHISRTGDVEGNATAIFAFPASLVDTGAEPVLVIRDSYLWNLTTSTSTICSGLGIVRLRDNHTPIVSYLDERFHSSNNLAPWGDFENTSLPRNVFIHTTTETQTDAWTASSDTLSIGNTEAYLGTQSLEITKGNGAGTAYKVGLIAPLSPGQHMLGWRYVMAKDTTGGGDITAWDTARWVYWDGSFDATTGIPVIQRESQIGQNSFTITDDSFSWTVHEMAISSPTRAPLWANALLLTIDLQGFVGTTGGTLYVDDFSLDGI